MRIGPNHTAQRRDCIIACEELLRDDDNDRTFYLMNTNAFDGRNDGSDGRREINSSEIRITRVLKAGEDYVELDDDLTELVQGRSVPRIKLMTQKLENEMRSGCLVHCSDFRFNFNFCCVYRRIIKP